MMINQILSNQVLSIEQMQELIELGIDTSKASLCWLIPKGKGDSLLHIYNEYDEWEYIEETFRKCPTFTLQDILEMLPSIIESNYHLNTQFNSLSIKYCRKLDDVLIRFYWEDNILEAAFEMLKWCKQNNYI